MSELMLPALKAQEAGTVPWPGILKAVAPFT